MSSLLVVIQSAVARGRYVFSNHADDMMRERGIAAWQVVGGVMDGKSLIERTRARPNPVVEVEQMLADGTPVKVVWAYLRLEDTAKLVTVHFFDG